MCVCTWTWKGGGIPQAYYKKASPDIPPFLIHSHLLTSIWHLMTPAFTIHSTPNVLHHQNASAVWTPGRMIGDSHPCFIIAEIGQNHQGDVEIAKKMIKMAKVNKGGGNGWKCHFASLLPWAVLGTEEVCSRKKYFLSASGMDEVRETIISISVQGNIQVRSLHFNSTVRHNNRYWYYSIP